MTIPIIPGPFSFVGELGKGLGGYISGKEDYRRNKFKENLQTDEFGLETQKFGLSEQDLATRQVGQIYEGVRNNQLSSNVLKSDFFNNLLQRSGMLPGLGAENVAPKPQEQLSQFTSEYIKNLQANMTPAASQELQQMAAAGGMVAPGARATDRTAALTQGYQGDVIEAGRAPTATPEQQAVARRTAGVLSGPVARAAEAAAVDPFFGTVAERFVDASLTGLKIQRLDPTNIPSVTEAAWEQARSDATARGFIADEQFTRQHIDSVIQKKLRQQEEEDTKRLIANNRDSGADPAKFLLDFYQKQQARVNDAISNLMKNKPDTVQSAFAAGIDRIARESNRTVQQVLDDRTTPADMKKAYFQVAQFQSQLASLQQEAQGYRDNLGSILGRAVGAPDPNALPVGVDRRQMPGGREGSFQSTTPPDATGQVTQRMKKARFDELAAIEKQKPPAQRRSSAELQAQVEQEFGGGAAGPPIGAPPAAAPADTTAARPGFTRPRRPGRVY